MRYLPIRIMVLIAGLLSCSIMLHAQQNNDKNKILVSLKNLEKMPKKDIKSVVSKFSPTDVPILYDIALDTDGSIAYRTRHEAIVIASYLNPEQYQIDRTINYAIKKLPIYDPASGEEDILAPIHQSIIHLYSISQKDEVIKPFRMLYDDKTCSESCKLTILQTLRETDAVGNRSLYNKILNDKDSSEMLKSEATFGLAQTGSMESIPYLSQMANYLFDTEIIKGHSFYYMVAIRKLRNLGSKHYEASEEVQKVITSACNIDPKDYSYQMKVKLNIYDLLEALKTNGGDGNRKFLENLLDSKCKYEYAVTEAIYNLGSLGNNETIDILSKYADLYAIPVKSAIAEIKQRNVSAIDLPKK
jgi:hypothetical protein